MQVLVTGATGFVGSHTVKAIKQQGHAVTVLVRDVSKAEKLFRQSNVVPDRIIEGSVTDPAAVASAIQGCDAVVHAAALTPMPGTDVSALYDTNVNGVRNVLDKALEAGIEQIVYVSSISAIFSTDPRKMTNDAEPALSTHPYGQSKSEAERYARSLQAAGSPVKIVYPGGIIGPDDPGFSATVYALKYRLTTGFRITSGGTQQIDVRDLATIIIRLLESPPQPGRYLTAGIFQAWADFADLLESITRQPLQRQKIAGWCLRLIGRFYDIKRLFMPVALPISAETMRYATQWPLIQNDPVIQQLGITLRSPRETFTDTIRWLCEAGHIDKRFLPSP